jgi:4-hydroxy-tetrahydrodipicolinate synthase
MGHNFKGLGVALVTPFDENGKIDFDALARLVDSVIEGGVDYLVTLGTTAETPTLDHAERVAVAAFVRQRNAGRVRLIIGMGSNDTAKLCAELRTFDLVGFDAVLTVAPYYNKPSQEGLYRHYRAVAEASPLPVIMYNIPGRTGVNMTAATTLHIAREVPGIIGIKEASGDIAQMEEIVKGAPDGFVVLSGDDAMVLPLVSVGGHGVISVIANVLPAQFASVVHTALDEGVAEAERLWEYISELCPLLFEEGNPTGIKTALAVKGICRPDVRLPLVEGSLRLRKAIENIISPIK